MYYVYELIDPRSGKVFYVGKGKGERAWQHEIYARKGEIRSNWRKYCIIKSIIAADLAVEIRIVKEFDIESEAYHFEEFHIRNTPGLTNIHSGGEIIKHTFKMPEKAERHTPEINAWMRDARKISHQVEIDRQSQPKPAPKIPEWVKRNVTVEFIDGPHKGTMGKISKIIEDLMMCAIWIPRDKGMSMVDAPIEILRYVTRDNAKRS